MTAPLTPEDIEPLLAEASFRCDTVVHNWVPRPWVPVPHRALFDKVYAPTEGGAWMTLENEKYLMRPGLVYLFPAGTIQRGEVDEPGGMKKVWIHFESFTVQTLHLLRLHPPPRALSGKSARRILDLSLAMTDEWNARRPARQLALRGMLLELLVAAYRAPASEHVAPDEILGPQDRPQSLPLGLQIQRVRKALQMIYQNGHQPLALRDVARSVHLHPVYFNQLFKRWVGMPPMRFLEQHRIRRAKELLSLTDRTVADIAKSVGYADPLYFSRAFKKSAGVSPTEYRDGSQRTANEL